MSRFRISRRGFIEKAAGAATLAAAAGCGGGGGVGGSPAPITSQTTAPGASPTANATSAPGATATPVATATATSASATATPAAAATGANFPSGSVSTGVRGPGSLPDSTKAAGTENTSLPFKYVVVLMMENHSFDNYFGMLPVSGQPLADGFSFDSNGNPTNKNPLGTGYNHVFHLTSSTCQTAGNNQTWAGTRNQINSGLMDGFAASDTEGMGYYNETDLPFYYSLAKTFCLGNRAFCSATAQTYPNRRYLYAGTSSGLVQTDTASFSMAAPTNGTLMDTMTTYGVSWMNYFTDLPATVIIPQNLENHPTNYAPVASFLAACAAGTLPSVSFVDPEFGLAGDVGQELFQELSTVPNLPASIATMLNNESNQGGSVSGDEEPPANIELGEAFCSEIINAVISSPLWPETLLIWTYDEHGGYYDHVQPLGAPLPDDIPPNLAATDPPGAFNITGIRIPTVVVSPYSKPGGVSNVPHDHTSIIATIAAKWNLPALTYRDAQANTLFDYLNLGSPPALLTPPALAAPATNGTCNTTPQQPVVSPNGTQRSPGTVTRAKTTAV